MALTPEQAKELKKEIAEIKDLSKSFAGDMKTVEALTKGTALNFGKIQDLADKIDSSSKKEKKFREDIRDLTKEVLENAENIGTEEFKSLDVAKQLAKARRLGDKELVKSLTNLKSINQLQKQQNKQITAAANLMKKPFEALDSAIREIPVIGELLADVADFGGIGDSLAQGMIEGFSSGLVETNFARMMSTTFNSAGRLIDAQSGRFVKQGVFIMALTRIREGFGRLTGLFRSLTLGGKVFAGAVVLGAAAITKMVTASISFANETGASYGDILKMAPALLINANAVKAFANELGTLNNLTTMQAAQLKFQEKLYGLSAESAAKLFAVQKGITNSSMEQFLALTKSTAKMARLAGVAPQAVFDDLANSAEAVAKFTDATGDNVFRAAIEAKKMGINLGVVDNIAESLLNFEESIAKEQELSMLMGRQINFNKARELFFNNKTVEGLKEVKAQMGIVGSLSEMDFVQRKAAASALGIQVSELGKIITNQEGANEAAGNQTLAFIGSMAAAAGIGAVLLGTAMALKAIFFGPGSLIKDMVTVKAAAISGASTGAMLGAGGMATYSALSGMTKLADGGVIVGEAGPEVVAPLPSQGVNIDNSGVEKRIDKLIEQNEFLMNRLTNRIGQQNLA